jgi:predicted phosphodiesterase
MDFDPLSRRDKLARLMVIIALLTIFLGCAERVPPDFLPQGGIVIYGDSRTHHSVHRKIVTMIGKLNPAAVFHTGDLVTHDNRPGEWATAKKIIKPLTSAVPFYIARGSHEKDLEVYKNNVDLPGNEQWYAVDIGGIHFIVLDSYDNLRAGSEQYRWLEHDLQNIPNDTQFTIVILHIPIYTTGLNMPSGIERNNLVPLFEKYSVDAVYAGHNHHYERIEHGDITYIITGGGGAPLYKQTSSDPESKLFFKGHHFYVLYVSEGKLNLIALDRSYNVVDSVVLEARDREVVTADPAALEGAN